MAAEAAILGTPAVFMHTARLGYMLELEDRYSLLWNTASQKVAEDRAFEVLDDLDAAAATWAERRQVMLDSKLDVGEWMLEHVRAALR